MNWLFSFLIILPWTYPAHSALTGILEPSLESAIPFYKSPQSQFPSGEARRSTLLKSQMGTYTDFHYKASWDGKTLLVKNEHILREIDITSSARLRKEADLKLFAEWDASTVKTLKKGQSVQIESIRGVWARVRVSKLHKGYVLVTELETPQEDPGVWTSLSEIPLRKSPDPGAPVTNRAPALTRFDLLHSHGDFAYLKSQNYTGYAPFKDLIGRVDFAELGWNQKQKKWQRISHRNGSTVVLKSAGTAILSDFTAFQSLKGRALMSSAHPIAPRGARITLVEPQAVKWTQSVLESHGPIWWKKELIEKEEPKTSITTAELLKKDLKGISFNSKTKKGLASAKGIYKTLDGKKWSKISFFGQQDWPVNLHPDGVWFVGPYRSTDQGKTFRPAIKWSELVQSLQKPRGRAFMHFRVLDVASLPNSQVMMKVDTGISVVKLRAHVLGHHWTPM